MARKGKIEGKTVWIFDRIKTANGNTMVYYRELNSTPSDIKTKVISKKRK